ncbi:hypothetical protein BH18VER1_BH18VER1_21000 [soil metagenome]
MKKFFGFGSSTPPPPPPPNKPPAPPAKSTPGPAAAAAASTIVGRWKEPGSGETTEFHSDGSVTEKTSSGETIRGRYSLQGKQLKINLEGVPNELSFPVAIAADTLEMSDSEGNVTLYQRV